MARFLEDVERETREAGGPATLGSRFSDCLSHPAPQHHWRELQTNVSPALRYCEDCKVVDWHGEVFWLVAPTR
jgi:hypothetical protein